MMLKTGMLHRVERAEVMPRQCSFRGVTVAHWLPA